MWKHFQQFCQRWQPELLHGTECVRCENLSCNFASAGSQNYSMELTECVRCENISNNFASAGGQNYSMELSVYGVKKLLALIKNGKKEQCQNCRPHSFIPAVIGTGSDFIYYVLELNSPIFEVLFYPVWRIRDVYPGSRILIFTHPGSRIPDLGSRIPDPGSKNSNKRERWKKNCYHTGTFFVVTNFTKLNIMLFLKC